jgi:diguanylate cyclase (GGDEF)-like protein
VAPPADVPVADVPAIVAEPSAPEVAGATQTVANETTAATATAAPASAAIGPSTNLPATSATAPSTAARTFGWLLALSLAVLAWWASARRSRRLADEAAALARQQRQLRNAHQQLQADSAQLRKLSIHDPLTGTLNRQAFATELRELIDQLSRYSRPLTLIVFDLDHFKQINDQQGHLAGDAALKLVVGIVREHLVSADLFGRFGGDEFLIACADQSPASCATLAETIRVAVETQAPAHDPPLPGLTLSIGLAQADASSGYDPDALFARADAALYAAKRRGRNCIVAADESLPSPDAQTLQRHL